MKAKIILLLIILITLIDNVVYSYCDLSYVEYHSYGTFGPNYILPQCTDLYGDWTGTWTLSNSGNPAWWKKDDYGEIIDKKTASEYNSTWIFCINEDRNEFSTIGTLEGSLSLHLNVDETRNCVTRLIFGYSKKYKHYHDSFSVWHISL